jgi:hypothetical protein
MGAWYWIGVATGLGVGAGIVIGALVPQGKPATAAAIAAALGVAAGIGIGFLVGDWGEVIGGGVGGALGGFLASLLAVPVVAGALRAGGTRFGIAVIVVLAGLLVAALAFVPALGYAEAVFAPLLAHRMRRRGDRRYAGLRILAKD